MNDPCLYDYIIIGGGLSGLYQARLILQHYQQKLEQQQEVEVPLVVTAEAAAAAAITALPKILILEGNDRLGGRIYSPKGHDMGGTWTWQNDKRVLGLCVELGIVNFEYDGDDANDRNGIIDISKSVNDDDNHENYKWTNLPFQLRFIGGSERMIHGIVNDFPKDVVTIHCQHQVIAIDSSSTTNKNNDDDNNNQRRPQHTKVISMNLHTNQQTSFIGKSITLAIPPRLIIRDITFLNPKLPTLKNNIMKNTPIWMENASKVYLTYKEKLWMDHHLPCNVLDLFVFDVSNDNNYRQSVSTSSTYTRSNDNNDEDKLYSLCLFQVGRGPSSPITKELLYATYIKRLSQVFNSRNILSDLYDIQIHNWAIEPFTSSLVNSPTTMTNHSSGRPSSSSSTTLLNTHNTNSVPPSFMFGNAELRKPLGDNIFFSSTETEQESGHMEGALKAGERVAAQAIDFVF
jgi:monoamine oxidase